MASYSFHVGIIFIFVRLYVHIPKVCIFWGFSLFSFFFVHFFYFRIYSYALSNLFLLQFSNYNLFVLPDTCTFKKIGHIIIYEKWVYYQDFNFKFSQNTAVMFKYNDIIHLCHEYQFDDKICSLQKQLQILHIFGEGLI